MVEIKKAKITKDNTLIVDYIRKDDDGNVLSEAAEKFETLVHADLRNAFNKLIPHIAVLCDLREGDVVGMKRGQRAMSEVTELDFAGLSVQSFSIGGDVDSEGVTISGQKKLASGKVFNINSPFQKYLDENDDYKWQSELHSAVTDCVFEVEEYMAGKCAIKQMSMDFGEGGEAQDADLKESKKFARKLKKDLADAGMTVSFSTNES